jgi:ubiquinone/menaquinone biosynthesis C-methylase UbiE
MKTIGFSCPVCRGGITFSDNAFACESCYATFKLLDGEIPDFSVNRNGGGNFYDGAPPQPVMKSLVGQMNDLGWRSVVKQFLKTLPPAEQSSMLRQLSEERAAWKYLLSISDHQAKALSCEIGMGSIALSLARNFGEVVCFELNTERLIFSKKRSEQLGIWNIVLVKGGDAAFLPFTDKSFDLVVLNGTLGWIPQLRKGDPRQVQLEFLREVHRVLKSDGECYIGIENRFSYENWLTKKKRHSNGLLQPRDIENLYSSRFREQRCRAYTHSIWGYKDLLKKAGFNQSRFFIPYPIYKSFSQIVGFSSAGKINPQLAGGQSNYHRSDYFFEKRLLKYLAPSFAITVSKGAPSESFLERLVDRVFKETDPTSRGLRNGSIQRILTTSEKVMVVVDSFEAGKNRDARSRFVIKIPLTPYARRCVEKNASALKAIQNDARIPKSISACVPRVVTEGYFCDQYYFVEELMPGVSAEKLQCSLSGSLSVMNSAVDSVTKLHLATRTSIVVDDSKFETLFAKLLMEVADFLEGKNERESLLRIIAAVRPMVLGASLPLVWSHGDCSLKNMLGNEKTLMISGMIDWDLNRQNGLPLIDVLHLIARDKMVTENLTLHGVLSRYLIPFNLSGFQRELTEGYLETLGIDRSLITPLCIMYWISRIHGHLGTHKDMDHAWVNKNFMNVMEDLSPNL